MLISQYKYQGKLTWQTWVSTCLHMSCINCPRFSFRFLIAIARPWIETFMQDRRTVSKVLDVGECQSYLRLGRQYAWDVYLVEIVTKTCYIIKFGKSMLLSDLIRVHSLCLTILISLWDETFCSGRAKVGEGCMRGKKEMGSWCRYNKRLGRLDWLCKPLRGLPRNPFYM